MTIRHLPPAHPLLPLTLADITGPLAPWLPASATSLVVQLGPVAALALLNRYPGVLIPNLPKTPNANPHGAARWADLAKLMGESAMQELAKLYGGGVLSVPNCHALRTQRLHAQLRARLDSLMAPPPQGQGMSKNKAITELCMEYAPFTFRQIEIVVDKPTTTEPTRQTALF